MAHSGEVRRSWRTKLSGHWLNKPWVCLTENLLQCNIGLIESIIVFVHLFMHYVMLLHILMNSLMDGIDMTERKHGSYPLTWERLHFSVDATIEVVVPASNNYWYFQLKSVANEETKFHVSKMRWKLSYLACLAWSFNL